MRITVSGLPGSGTTTFSTSLSELLKIEVISAGQVFRQMAAEHKMTLSEFGLFCESDPSVDRLIDEKQREIALSQDDILVEGRLSGKMVPEADLKIWLMAPLSVRVKRVHERDLVSDMLKAEQETVEREACEAQRYMKYYDIDITDLSVYDIVLNTESFSVEQLVSIVKSAVENLS